MKAASEGQIDLPDAPTSAFEDQDDSIALDIDDFPTDPTSTLAFEDQDDSIPLDIDDFPTAHASALPFEDQDASAMQISPPGPSWREDTPVNFNVGVLHGNIGCCFWAVLR